MDRKLENLNENCMAVALTILQKVVPDKIEIQQAFRIGKMDEKKHRSILIQFKTRLQRNMVFNNRANLKKLGDRETRFFLNENLPPNLKGLLGKANSLRKQNNYKFLWTNGGVILVKKDEKSISIPIRKKSDLQNIV